MVLTCSTFVEGTRLGTSRALQETCRGTRRIVTGHSQGPMLHRCSSFFSFSWQQHRLLKALPHPSRVLRRLELIFASRPHDDIPSPSHYDILIDAHTISSLKRVLGIFPRVFSHLPSVSPHLPHLPPRGAPTASSAAGSHAARSRSTSLRTVAGRSRSEDHVPKSKQVMASST